MIMKGDVTNYVKCLGAGYILGEDGHKYLVRLSDVIDGKLSVGMKVTFMPILPEAKGGGFRAKKVATV